MKKQYVKPIMLCDTFVANQYVATCAPGIKEENIDNFTVTCENTWWLHELTHMGDGANKRVIFASASKGCKQVLNSSNANGDFTWYNSSEAVIIHSVSVDSWNPIDAESGLRTYWTS